LRGPHARADPVAFVAGGAAARPRRSGAVTARWATALWLAALGVAVATAAFMLLAAAWGLLARAAAGRGLLVAALALPPLLLGARALLLAGRVAAGRLPPRLARRQWRDTLSNLAMFGKTGMWRW